LISASVRIDLFKQFAGALGILIIKALPEGAGLLGQKIAGFNNIALRVVGVGNLVSG
jgi:hypothetical protein